MTEDLTLEILREGKDLLKNQPIVEELVVGTVDNTIKQLRISEKELSNHLKEMSGYRINEEGTIYLKIF